MANVKTILKFSVCIFLVIAAFEFALSEAKRYGGSSTRVRYGGSRNRVRYGSTRNRVRYGGSRTRVRYGGSRNRVRYGGSRVRIRSGSSPFTRSTFTQALILGHLYGSLRYMRSPRYIRHPDHMPTICTNNYDSDGNGTVYGYFICPRMGEQDNYEYCCGDNHRERCCEYFDEDDQGRTAGIVIGVIILIIIIAIIVYCVCKKTGTGGKIVKKFSSRKHDDSKTYTAIQKDPGPVNMVPVPTQPPEKNHPGSYPPSNSYDYTDSTNQYNPQHDKPPMPQADFNNGGQPYPSNPSFMPYGGTPYSQDPQNPYPPGGSPYPGNQHHPNPTSYPPGGSPYPGNLHHTDPTSYPPGGSPYPGNQHHPDPTSYPTGGSPYPNSEAYQHPGNNSYPVDNPPAPYPPPPGYGEKGPSYPNSPPPSYPQ